MNIATYKAAAKAWVLAQGNGMGAQFRDEKGGWLQKPRAWLHFMGSGSIGVDHLRWLKDEGLAAGVDLVPTVSGDRDITLSIFVESRNQAGDNTAGWYLEKLRASLKKPSVHDALYTAGLAYSTVERVVDLTSGVDDRIESKASMDVHFNAVENERDEDEGGSYTETAEMTGELVAEE